MRIVFFGTGDFAVPALEVVSEHIALVVTQPDRPSGRGMKLQPSPVKLTANKLGLPVDTPDKARDNEFIERIRNIQPDFHLVAAYGQILPLALLDTARHGGINIHGSILPKYRGAAPIQRSILNGDTETGVTLIQMDKGMDTGDIIRIVKTPIDRFETYGELQHRLSLMGADLVREMIPLLQTGLYPRMPQSSEGASIAPKVRKEEAELRFEQSAQEAYNRFRAFTPSPGAYFTTCFGRVRLSNVSLLPASSSLLRQEPGTILPPNLVAFKDGWLELIEVQPEGKKRMSGRDFFNGVRLHTGDSLIHGPSR